MDRPPTPDALARRVFDGQVAVITRAQARRCGLSDDQIDYRLACGDWEARARGVFALNGSPRGWLQDAMTACLAGPTGTVASFLTAAALAELWRPPLLPHVSVPPGSSARLSIAKVHRVAVPQLDRIKLRGIASTTASRTIADCATLLGPADLARIVDDAFCRNLATTDSVLASVGRAGPGREGRGRLLEVLDAWAPGIRPGSPAEMRALRLFEQWGFGRPIRQHEIRTLDGRYVGRVDLAYVDDRVGIEYAGKQFHGPRRWVTDEPRFAGMKALGWRVLEMDKADLLPGERGLRDALARELDAPAA